MDKNKIIYALIAIVIIIGFIYKCNDADRNIGQTDELKTQIEQYRQSAKQHLTENADLKKIIDGLAQADKDKVAQIAEKQAEIGKLKDKLDIRKSEAAKDYPQFFANRYNMLITIDPQPAQSLIANDLLDGDNAKEELNLTKSELVLERERIMGKDSIIGASGKIITNLESAVKDFESAIDVSEKVIFKQDQFIKKKSRQNLLLKIAIPAAFVAGMLTK